MAVHLNPKGLFQANSQQREEWAQIVANPLFQRACCYTLAEMVVMGLSPEGLAGVNSCLYILQNLSETTPPVKALPAKSLKSYDNPTPTQTKTEPLK